MNKRNIFTSVVVIILIILGWTILLNKDKLFTFQKESETPQLETREEVNLVINEGEGSPIIINSDFKEGMTAFSLLKEKTEELGLSLRTKTYDIGVLIEAIGNRENGEDGKYWLYYVNDEMPMVAVDKKEIHRGDRVEFRFEKSPF